MGKIKKKKEIWGGLRGLWDPCHWTLRMTYDFINYDTDYTCVWDDLNSLVKLHYFHFAFLENCVYEKQKKSIKDQRHFCSNTFFKVFANYFYFYFLYGWIAGGWEAHFRNYRHYVIYVPSAPWTDYPIPLTRHWLTQVKIHSLAKWIAVSGNRTAIACEAMKVHDHYIPRCLF